MYVDLMKPVVDIYKKKKLNKNEIFQMPMNLV